MGMHFWRKPVLGVFKGKSREDSGRGGPPVFGQPRMDQKQHVCLGKAEVEKFTNAACLSCQWQESI